MTKVINLFAGPGAGKSTTAAGLFYQLKIRDIKCELVTEYAKDMTYEKRHNILADQLYILAKQNRRVFRLINEVDYVITDSPIILGLMYKPIDYFQSFEKLVWEMFNNYENVNFFVTREKKYQSYGRSQTEDQAREKDLEIQRLLQDNFVPFLKIKGNADAPFDILNTLGIE